MARPKYLWHGGCHDCTNDEMVCPKCCYFEADWSLPDKNPIHAVRKAREDAERKRIKAASTLTKASGCNILPESIFLIGD